MAKSVAQVVQQFKIGTGSGGVFTAAQVKPYLDKQLQGIADEIKATMIGFAELQHRHKFRKDGSGFVKTAKVTMTTDGGKITLPSYAVNLDTGRKPGSYPPIAAIIAWVKRYRILARVKGSGRFQKVEAKSINSTAIAIQKSIFKNGIKAKPFIDATLSYQNELISKVIDEIMIPEIVSILEYQFKS
jgi:hypothetical protein